MGSVVMAKKIECRERERERPVGEKESWRQTHCHHRRRCRLGPNLVKLDGFKRQNLPNSIICEKFQPDSTRSKLFS